MPKGHPSNQVAYAHNDVMFSFNVAFQAERLMTD